MMRFGAGFLRSFGVAAIAGLAAVAIGQETRAQGAPVLPAQEDARLALIDYCVMEESSRRGQYDNYVVSCKCATDKLIGEMNEQEMQGVAKWRKPTSAVKKRWDSAWQSCN